MLRMAPTPTLVPLRPHPPWLRGAALAVCTLLSSCGEPRCEGDPGAPPVAVAVHLERSYLKDMRNMQGHASCGVDAAAPPAGVPTVGGGMGFSFASTEVALLGGEGEGDDAVFRHALSWGDNAFAIPLLPGRRLFLAIEAQGGRVGLISLGEVVVPAGPQPRIALELRGAGARMVVSPLPPPAADGAPTGIPPPAPAAAPASAPDGRPPP